jgi:NAD(P)H-dependent FMN reductase
MRTTIFSCSERQDNLTFKAAKAVAHYFDNPEIVDLRNYHLNIFGTADEDSQKNLAELTRKFKESEQIVIISPEYNWGLSPNAKNLLDYLSVSKDNEIWNEKVFMCFGCSAGRGGRLPVIELWKILNKLITFANATSVVSPYHLEITGNLISPKETFIADFEKTAERIFNNHKKLAEAFLRGLKGTN